MRTLEQYPCSLGCVLLQALIFVIYMTQQEKLLGQAAGKTIVFCVYYLLHRTAVNNRIYIYSIYCMYVIGSSFLINLYLNVYIFAS